MSHLACRLISSGIVHSVIMLRKLVYSTIIMGFLFMLWNIRVLIKLPKDKPEKNQSSIVLLGMVIGLVPFVILTVVPQLFNFQRSTYKKE